MVVHTVVQPCPCNDCPRATICGPANPGCQVMQVFVLTVRLTAAPRRPSKEIAQVIENAAPRAPTVAQRWRNYEAVKVKMLRDRPLR
jgi:hypothetical protein